MKLFFIHLLLVVVSVERFPNKVKNLNLKKIHLMSGLNEARFIVRHESHKCKRELNKVYVIQSKYGILMNVGVIVKN